MQIEFLKIFCDVVRHKSFSEGAAQNKVTQSTASQTIKHIEDRMGALLIDRTCRPWKLTEEGKLFYHGSLSIVNQYYKLEAEMKGFQKEAQSILRVACIYSVGLRHMRRLVEKFSEQNPHVKVNLEYLHPDKIYESIRNEEIDLGVVSFPKSERHIEVIPWQFEPMVVACYPGHELANQKQVSLKKINSSKFVAFDKGLGIRKEVDRFLKQHSVVPEVTLEFDNIEAIKRAVEAGSGLSVLPAPTLEQEVKTGSLRAIPFSPKGFVRPLGIIHRKGPLKNENFSSFVSLLKEECKFIKQY